MRKSHFPFLREAAGGIFCGLVAVCLFVASTVGQTQAGSFLEAPLQRCFAINWEGDQLIASDNEQNFLLASSPNLIKTINIAERTDVWQSVVGGRLQTRPLTDQTNTYVIAAVEVPGGQTRFVVRSISNLTGVTNWQRDLESLKKPFLIQTKTEIFVVDAPGNLFILDKPTGKPLGQNKLKIEVIAPPVLTDEEIIVPGKDRLIVFKRADFQNEKVIKTKGPVTSLLAAENQKLYWGDNRGNLVAWDLVDNRRVWETKVGARVSSLAIYEEGVLVTSYDNYIYFYARGNGNVIWKKRTANRIVEKPLLAGNYAVVVGVGDQTATVLNLENGRTVNTVLLAGEAYFFSPPVLVRDVLLFPSSDGLIAFGRKGCAGQ